MWCPQGSGCPGKQRDGLPGSSPGPQGGAVQQHLHGVGLEGRRGGGAESGPAPTPTLLSQLLQQCRLVERILTSWEENDLVQ